MWVLMFNHWFMTQLIMPIIKTREYIVFFCMCAFYVCVVSLTGAFWSAVLNNAIVIFSFLIS